TVGVTITGSKGYARIWTSAQPAVISSTGTSASYNVTVTPDAPFAAGETLTIQLTACDVAGNQLQSPAWSLTVGAAPSAPVITGADPLSPTSIRWSFTDTAGNENGFSLHDPDNGVKGLLPLA